MNEIATLDVAAQDQAVGRCHATSHSARPLRRRRRGSLSRRDLIDVDVGASRQSPRTTPRYATSLFASASGRPRLGMGGRGLAELLFVVGSADARQHGPSRQRRGFFEFPLSRRRTRARRKESRRNATCHSATVTPAAQRRWCRNSRSRGNRRARAAPVSSRRTLMRALGDLRRSITISMPAAAAVQVAGDKSRMRGTPHTGRQFNGTLRAIVAEKGCEGRNSCTNPQPYRSLTRRRLPLRMEIFAIRRVGISRRSSLLHRRYLCRTNLARPQRRQTVRVSSTRKYSSACSSGLGPPTTKSRDIR